MAKTSNELFQDAMLRHQISLLRYSGHIRNRIFKLLDATESDIADKIRSRLLGSEAGPTPALLRRLEGLEKAIKLTRGAAWKKTLDVWEEELTALALAQPSFVDNALKTVLPVIVGTELPSPTLLKAIVKAKPFEGKVLRKWAMGIAQADLDRIFGQIQIGLVQGESSRDIARRVLGTATIDGAADQAKRAAEAITRTAVNHVANLANREYFEANKELMTGEVFVATLDARTTPICRSLDGEQFPVGEGPIPPLHFNCRSIRTAVIDGEVVGQRPSKPVTEKMLVKEYAKENDLGDITSREDLPRGHKGTFDSFSRRRIRELVGPVPAKTTYAEWLRGQSVDFQKEVLGPTRYKLWKDGGLTLDKFVNRAGDEIPLGQLSRLQRDAFKAAGLDPTDF